MNKKFGIFISVAALVLGFVGCKEPQLAVDGIDFAYNNYQTIHVTNNSSSALSVEGSAMFANAHSDGGYGLCYDEKKSVLSLEPGESGTIGFRRTVGLGIPDVSFEATFKYGNKNLTYAGWSEDFNKIFYTFPEGERISGQRRYEHVQQRSHKCHANGNAIRTKNRGARIPDIGIGFQAEFLRDHGISVQRERYLICKRRHEQQQERIQDHDRNDDHDHIGKYFKMLLLIGSYHKLPLR